MAGFLAGPRRVSKRCAKMLGMSKPNATIAELETFAEAIRRELEVPRQSDLFRAAVQAGYLTALADGACDDAERATLVKAVEILSVGAVIEWEVESLLEECDETIKSAGALKLADQCGASLKELRQAEAGILLAAAVARATKKIDKKEAEMLKAVGKAAGITGEQVGAIVKRASGIV